MFGLRGKLTILACSFCLIPCLVITAFVYTMVVNNFTEMIRRDMESAAEVKAHWLETWCNELLLIVQDAASNEVFFSQDEARITEYLRGLRDYWGAETVALVEHSGTSRINTFNTINKYSDTYVKQALAGSPAHGGIGTSHVTSNPIFSAAAPIIQNGEVIGALVINRNIQEFANNFNQSYGYESRDSFIVNPSNVIMTEGRLNNKIRLKILGAELASAINANNSGSARYKNHDDVAVIGAWHRSSLGWTIVEEVELAEAMAVVYRRLPIFFFLVGGLIVIALLLGRFIATRIGKPISKVALSANRIAEGNLALDNKVDITQRDEIGHLAKAFNAMVDNLRYLIAKVKETAKELDDKSTVISSSSNNMASCTADQANIAQGVNRAVGELAKASEAIAVSSLQAQQSGRMAYQDVKESSTAVMEAVESLNTIKDAVYKLGISSSKIGEIVSVIDDIADQTNLLALNAAIEAARAGEHGKSFTVVAEAVGNLALRASNSTKEIAKLIGETQEQIQETVKISDSGAARAHHAMEAMEKIIGKIQQITESIDEISAAGEQQSAHAGEVTSAMENLSATSEEVSAGAQEMASSAKILARQSELLLELVANFYNI